MRAGRRLERNLRRCLERDRWHPAGHSLVGNRRWAALAGGEHLHAALDLARADGETGSFGDAVDRWLADPDLIAAADFERAEPYCRLRTYSAPVRHQASGELLGRI